MDSSDFEKIIKSQDDMIRALNVDVWVGMEPTFTDRFAQTPEWLSQPLGPDKLVRAYALLKEAYDAHPGGAVMHTLGRQYEAEDQPRWNIGYYQVRNNAANWKGPPDPALLKQPLKQSTNDSINIVVFWQSLNDLLRSRNWQTAAFQVKEKLGHRILFRCDGSEPIADIYEKPLLRRASVHGQKIPVNGLNDELSTDGDLLLAIGIQETKEPHYRGATAVIELPQIPMVQIFLQLLDCIAQAAKIANLPTLMIQGFPPPVDATVAWTTITPDPAVIEINQAPSDSSLRFYEQCKWFYRAAQKVGLHSYRLYYNGLVSDSGGGGQFTLGGPTPQQSPFFCHPHVLPRLIRYFNAHPVLSYWFAPPSIGSFSQSPRADERMTESFLELNIALEQLNHYKNPSPEFIWRTLSPFLVDPSGNPHRSEINIEKLWNPHLPDRGCLGLVEFRAFRMSRTPESATAITVLLRSLVAMLSREDKVTELFDHGLALHDRYALPWMLLQDWRNIFKDLAEAHLPLHSSIQSLLLNEPIRMIGQAEFRGVVIEVQQALEFWPLVGDVASQEGGGSRLVDASTTRLQITLKCIEPTTCDLDGWELWLDGYRIPLRDEQGKHDLLKIIALRYRNFQPAIGLHPGILARHCLSFLLVHRDSDEALKLNYYDWRPEGQAYPGLPNDLTDAETRRSERFVTQTVSVKNAESPKALPNSAVTDYCIDLRRLPTSWLSE